MCAASFGILDDETCMQRHLLSLAVTQRVIVVTIGVLVAVLTTLISAAFGGDTSQFLHGRLDCSPCVFSRGYGRPYSLNCTHPIAHVIPKWPGLRNLQLVLDCEAT
jgi:hypothetical protein